VNDPKTVSELVVELTRTIVRYVRQELGKGVQESVVAPLESLRIRILYAIVAAFAFGVAIVFASIGLFLILEKAIKERWAAMLIVALLVAGAGFYLFQKGMSGGQRKEIARRDTPGHPVPGGPDQGEGGSRDSRPPVA